MLQQYSFVLALSSNYLPPCGSLRKVGPPLCGQLKIGKCVYLRQYFTSYFAWQSNFLVTAAWGDWAWAYCKVSRVLNSFTIWSSKWCCLCLLVVCFISYLQILVWQEHSAFAWSVHFINILCNCFFILVFKGTVHPKIHPKNIFLLHLVLFISLNCFDLRCLVLEISAVDPSAFSQI